MFLLHVCCSCSCHESVWRGSTGIAVLILNFDTTWKWVVNVTPYTLHSREIRLGPVELEPGWASDPILTISRRENYYAATDI
jgi:hypothetical protein